MRLTEIVALLTGPHTTYALHVDVGLDEAAIVDHIEWSLRTAARQLIDETQRL